MNKASANGANIRRLTLDLSTNVSNISEVREELKTHCLQHLPKLALSIDSLTLAPIAEMPDIPVNLAPYSATSDPGGFRQRAYEYDLRANKAEIKACKDQNENLFGVVYGLLSE